MLTVYGRATSSNTQLVMWAIGELGLEHERLDYGGAFGNTGTPEFRAMNPMGLVPVLRDGSLTMFESGAILRYLAGRYGSEPFWPSDPVRRAALDVWAEWGKVTLAPPLTALYIGIVRTPPSRQDEARIAEGVAATEKLLRILAARLGEGPWLAGSDFTFADLAVAYLLYRYYTLPIARTTIPGIAAYYARLQERPAFRAHAMIDYTSLYVGE
jgi:glutathione S-transferase